MVEIGWASWCELLHDSHWIGRDRLTVEIWVAQKSNVELNMSAMRDTIDDDWSSLL